MNALLVKHGEITRITLPDGDAENADAIHDHIGNWFTSCFHIAGVGPYHGIFGYCDDEGLLTATPHFNVVPDGNLRSDGQAIAGPIVIVGSNEKTGESRGLLDVEMEMFSISKTDAVLLTPLGKVVTIPFLLFNRLDQMPIDI